MTSINIKSTILLENEEIKKYIIIDIVSSNNFSYEIFGEDKTHIKNKVNCNKFSTCFECNEHVTYLIKLNSDDSLFKFFKYDNDVENNIYDYYKTNIVMNIKKKNSLQNQNILNDFLTLQNINISSDSEENNNDFDIESLEKMNNILENGILKNEENIEHDDEKKNLYIGHDDNDNQNVIDDDIDN